MRTLSSPLKANLFLVVAAAALLTACASKEKPIAAAVQQVEHALPGASAPPPPKEFKAYFASGKASLSAEERRTVETAAAEWRANPSARVKLVGKTDTRGAEDRNMALSQRRTEAVSKALVAAGVPADRIDRQSVGESQPEVPTGNGVREPRNRVVDISVGI
jgi:OOP family OmpA-OmpF porin